MKALGKDSVFSINSLPCAFSDYSPTSVQLYFSMLLLALAAVCVGLLFASLPFLNAREQRRAPTLWVASVTLYALTLGLGAWLLLKLDDVSSSSHGLGMLAHTMGFSSLLLQAALIRSLNEAPGRADVPWGRLLAAVIAFALACEWVIRYAPYNWRVVLAASGAVLAMAWQVRELRRLRENDANYQLRYLTWLAIAGFGLASARALLAATLDADVALITQIPAILSVVAVAQIVCSVLSFGAITRYWAERASFEHGKVQMESAQVKALMAEKDRLILQLIAANKTAATGALSATLVHELAQPMTALQLNLTLLSSQNEDAILQQSRHTLLAHCMHNMGRLRDVLRTVRGMFVDDETDDDMIDVDEVIRSVHALIDKEARRAAVCVHVDTSGALRLRGRAAELRHAILNLALNALQSLRNCDCPEKRLQLSASGDGERITISVADNGHGVDEAMTSRLFNLLESGRPDGMGLGLWLCRHIADRHHGAIAYRPNTPNGAIFDMVLPVHAV